MSDYRECSLVLSYSVPDEFLWSLVFFAHGSSKKNARVAISVTVAMIISMLLPHLYLAHNTLFFHGSQVRFRDMDYFIRRSNSPCLKKIINEAR